MSTLRDDDVRRDFFRGLGKIALTKAKQSTWFLTRSIMIWCGAVTVITGLLWYFSIRVDWYLYGLLMLIASTAVNAIWLIYGVKRLRVERDLFGTWPGEAQELAQAIALMQESLNTPGPNSKEATAERLERMRRALLNPPEAEDRPGH